MLTPRPVKICSIKPTRAAIAALQARGAFSFAAWAEGVDARQGWNVLNDLQPDGAIPAVADQAVILWGLGKAVGDTLTIMDGRGRPRELRLVAGLQNRAPPCLHRGVSEP